MRAAEESVDLQGLSSCELANMPEEVIAAEVQRRIELILSALKIPGENLQLGFLKGNGVFSLRVDGYWLPDACDSLVTRVGKVVDRIISVGEEQVRINFF